MQFRPPPLFLPGHSEEEEEGIVSSLVINVGSGKGTKLADIATIMEDIIPPNDDGMEPTQDTQSIISGLEAEAYADSTNANYIISSRITSAE